MMTPEMNARILEAQLDSRRRQEARHPATGSLPEARRPRAGADSVKVLGAQLRTAASTLASVLLGMRLPPS